MKKILCISILIISFVTLTRSKDYFDYNILYKETSKVKERETALDSFFERVSTPKGVSAFNIFSIMLTEKNNASLFRNDDANLKETNLHLSKIKDILDALFALSDISGLVKNQNFLLHYFMHEENDGNEEFCETFVDNTHFTTNHLINCLVELYEQYKNM